MKKGETTSYLVGAGGTVAPLHLYLPTAQACMKPDKGKGKG